MSNLCPDCGKELAFSASNDTAYCGSCDKIFTIEPVEQAMIEDRPICPKCGKDGKYDIAPHGMFCGHCGYRFRDARVEPNTGRMLFDKKNKTIRAYIRMNRAGVEILMTVNLKSRTVAGMLTEITEAIGEIDAGGVVLDSVSFCEVVE